MITLVMNDQLFSNQKMTSTNPPEIIYNSDGNVEIIQFEENSWVLLNTNGKLVDQGKENNIVNIQRFPPGLYFLTIKQKTYRILKI